MEKQGPALKNATSYRVIYGDTDQMGIVYYANYLRWFESGRSEFLRQIGLPYTSIEKQGFHFPVAEVSCRYFQSAHYDDRIKIETELRTVGHATLTFHYRISREEGALLLASGSTRHACSDSAGKIARIPQALKEALRAASADSAASGRY